MTEPKMYGQLTPDQYFHLAWQWYMRAPVYLVNDWGYRVSAKDEEQEPELAARKGHENT